MIMGDTELTGEGAGTRLRARVGRWVLWSGPRGVPAVFLIVEGLAAAVAAVALLRSSYQVTEFVRFGSLLGLAFVQAELSRSVERLRRSICDAPHINMTSVWTFAGVLVLSCLAAGAVVSGQPGLTAGFTGSLRLVEAAAVFTAANAFIVALSVYLHTGGRSLRSLFGSSDDNLLELTIC